ncbi:hypothetical protein [Leucobacter sp. L43]|uniref:hypothetical protein n=1 Tax=Leucobacter sp. L43 TaxID=2798040 RepID=UPI0019070BF1|nr:hypothetical protein [Leucobacter sp. L43]
MPHQVHPCFHPWHHLFSFPKDCDDSRVKKLAVSAAVLLLALTGCTAQAETSSEAAQNSENSAEPTIDPGPIELTKEEAGERYLQLVCQGNTASDAVINAFNAHLDEFNAGGTPEVETVKAAAAELVRVNRMQIETIDDDYYVWPEIVGDQLLHIRAETMTDLAADQAVMNAQTYEEALRVTYNEATAEQQAAPQEIRYQLGIDADTTSSCVGYETALDEIHAEMLERNEQLAAQE